jgi:hypothetical protein
VNARLRELAPDGVNVFFDNVGGPILDAVLDNLAMRAKVVICGAISQYDDILHASIKFTAYTRQAVGDEKRGDLRPRLFDGRTGILAETVETRRVAENIAEKGQHRLNHPLIGRRRRRIIHIDRSHHLLPKHALFSLFRLLWSQSSQQVAYTVATKS